MPRSPSALLAACWKDSPPEAARVGRAAYRALRERLPGATVFVYDYPRGLVVAFGPAGRPYDAPVSLAMRGEEVHLYFLHGTELDDPGRVLRGKAKLVRYVRLDEPDTAIGSLVVKRLLAQALARVEPPLPRAGGAIEVRKARR